ncbi:MAG: 3'(2'),5'-bisphosphate nucleotidase CysQ [Planctomycetes bacterium]|nr:3'(2'),5'-bisphosphate nucleotidase CysQ [Planctomycetota bacterium]
MTKLPATTDGIERDLALAVAAAREAGVRVEGLRKSGRWADEAILGDIGDQAADGYLRGLLEGRCPGDGVLSEETADSSVRLSKSRVWIVDPLDGTKEYGQRREDWAVHVALCIDGQCALGAVALPASGAVLWGVCLPGQERAGLDQGTGQSLLRGDSPGPAAPRMVVSRSHTPEWTSRFASLLGVGEQQPVGSVGFKVSRLLLGHADVYVHKKGLKEWDTCAPEAVARALGWSVCRLRGDAHRYNQKDPKNHELVVCRPALKARVLEALSQSGALEA